MCALPKVYMRAALPLSARDLWFGAYVVRKTFSDSENSKQVYLMCTLYTLPNICYILYYLNCVHRHITANFLLDMRRSCLPGATRTTPEPFHCVRLNKWKKPRVYIMCGSEVRYI